MRPPIVRRCSGAPSRGQVAPRTRATWRSPVWLPPRLVSRRIVRRSVAVQTRRPRRAASERPGRAGSSPARHRISSASRLPIPATWLWSSSHALSGRPAARRGRRGGPAAVTASASVPRCAVSGSSCTPPRRRGSTSSQRRRRRRSAGRSGSRPGRRGRSSTRAARSGRCRRRAGDRSSRTGGRGSGPSVSSSSSLPMRRVPVTVRPVSVARSARAVVPPLRYQSSGASTARDGTTDGALRDARGSTRPRSSPAWARHSSTRGLTECPA